MPYWRLRSAAAARCVSHTREREEAKRPRLPDPRKQFADYTEDEWKAIHAKYDALEAEQAERNRAEARAAQPQEQRLGQDIARFQAEGNVLAAALAANELKLVRQGQSWS